MSPVGKSPYFPLARGSHRKRADDDATMTAEAPMAIEERLERLEVKVERGFADVGTRMGGLETRMGGLDRRMDRMEDRFDAMNTKLDVAVESFRDDMKTLVELVDGHVEEMRRTTESIRKEHAADRRLMYAMLRDHTERLRLLELDPSVTSADLRGGSA
jgi:hypothetical protein